MRAMMRAILGVVVLSALVLAAGQPSSLESKPAWRRLLVGEDEKKAAKLQKQLADLLSSQKWMEARKTAEELAALRADRQGKDHWQAIDARWKVAALKPLAAASAEKQKAYTDSQARIKEATLLEGKGRHAAVLPLRLRLLAVSRELFGEEHPYTATSYHDLGMNRYALAKYADAEADCRTALAIRRKVLGERHPDTAEGYNDLALNQSAQGKSTLAEAGFRRALAIYREVLGEEDIWVSRSYASLALNQYAQGKYAEAEDSFLRSLAICRKVRGEEDANTAMCYSNLAANQLAQGKHAQSEAGFRKALAIQRALLGEHPDMALSYNNLAANLNAQGKFVEAEQAQRKALDISLKFVGEDHPATARSYNNLAAVKNEQGHFAEAEVGFRKALTIYRKVFGEDHPLAADSYLSLAANQRKQGKYAEADLGLRKALAIYRVASGEEHPATANCYNSLAVNLSEQGKNAEAEENHRKALAVYRKIFGEYHPQTANSYNNLGSPLSRQGKLAEAESSYLEALTIRQQILAENHPDIARSYTSLGVQQRWQGKYADAMNGLRKALEINRKVFGERHPTTAMSYHHLAATRHEQGKHEEAEKLGTKAADSFSATRLQIAAAGLDRATITADRTPLPLLAALLARNGKPALAWQRFEESLARGTGDDFAARLKRPAAERQRQSQLLVRVQRLEGQLQRLATMKEPTRAQQARREELLGELLREENAMVQLNRELEDRYGPVAGEVLEVAVLQKALPADGAFVGWLDLDGRPKAADPNGEHWAVLLKARGEPIWVRLSGRGSGGQWTPADSDLPGKLHGAIVSPAGDWQPLARQLRAQRMQPLAGHLKGVRQLIILPSEWMDGIPVEVLSDGFTVSYGLSASLFAHGKRQPRPGTAGLVVLGDPTFTRPEQPELPLPPGGLLLTVVPPGSPAGQKGLKSGDVLLRYGNTVLSSLADLQKASTSAGKEATIKVWRIEPGSAKAKELTLQVPAGTLGVVVAREPAPKALAAQWRSSWELAARDSNTWQPLPGTRYEASALKTLFVDTRPVVLLGSEANETKLAELASGGPLGKARYIHMATHGESRVDKPLASRIILSRDRLSEGQSGELTAERVLVDWKLDADLVTLSACQSGLGKYERGEGFVGFAQALMLAGARSVCLSRWNVNDVSTALLMERFYQNLLGKRPGLKAPMGKAVALAEAKQWLRTLPRSEALKRAEAIGAGVERGPGVKELPRLEVRKTEKDEPPYAHPFYWAGFVLVGDRD